MSKKRKIIIPILFIFIIIFTCFLSSFLYVKEDYYKGKEKINKEIIDYYNISWNYPSEIGEYKFLKISDVSPYIIDGYIAVEDKNFYNHNGINIKSLIRASLALIKNKGKITQGGSSITQQVIKNNVLSQEKTFKRKFAEIYLSLYLEKHVSKDYTLEMYVNYPLKGSGLLLNGSPD